MPFCAALLAIALASAQMAASARDAYARAVELEKDGNYPAALALLWETAGLAPDDADVQNRLGEALERIGALDAAIDAYTRALTARPAFRKAANNLILVLAKAGRGPEAVTRARALVAAAPDDAEALFTLGLAQSEQDVDEAIRVFQQVLQRAPSHVLAHYNLALVLKRVDRAKEAIDQLTRAIAIEPRPEAHYTLGAIYFQQGEFDRAVRSLRAAIELQPAYADAWLTLGAVRRATRDFPAAADALRRAIGLRPESWSAHATLGQVLRQAGDERGAREHGAESERLRARAQREQEAGVWTAVGTAELDGGDPKAAVARFRRAIDVFDDYAPAHYQLARALQRIGDTAAAKASFARARQLNPSLVPPEIK